MTASLARSFVLTYPREQEENARENPIAADAVAAAASGGQAQPQSNIENLLDIDFDGSVPASLQKQPGSGESGLEGLAGTPQRVASPATGNAAPASTMDDLLGLFGDGGAGGGPPANTMSNDDMMNGFAGMNLSGSSQPPPPQQQQQGGQAGPKSNQDLLDLF